MIKNYLWAWISPLIIMSSSYIYKPDMVDCARAAHMVYHKDISPATLKLHKLSQYDLVCDITKEKTGMRVIALKLKETNNIIVSYRGTDSNNKANLLIDLGIAAAELESDQLNSDLVYNHAQQWLKKYCNELLGSLTHATKYLPTNLALKALGTWGYDLETGKSYKARAVNDAFLTFEMIKKEHPGCSYYLTGHSLGGFYAQLIGYHYGHTAYTFNAPGAYHTYRQCHPRWARILRWMRRKNKITNYVRDHDLVGTFGVHLGTVKIIPNGNVSNEENDQTNMSIKEQLWLLYQLPNYVRNNHGIRHLVNDLVASVS